MGIAEIKLIAEWIDEVLCSTGDPAVAEAVHQQVVGLCGEFPIPNNHNT